MSARSRRLGALGSVEAKAAAAMVACGVLLLAGCGSSSAADTAAPAIRGMPVFSEGPLVVTTTQGIVTFHANGGTGTMPSQTETPMVVNYLNANAFTGPGHLVFDGWATTPTGSRAYANMAEFPFTSDASLYARWAPATVTFAANGGTGTMPSQTSFGWTVLHSNTFTSPSPTMLFWGWSQTGSSRIYVDGDWFPFNAVATLHAEWRSISWLRTH